MEKEKVEKVTDWLVLRSIKNMQKFLKLANYYRQFIKNFTKIAKLLHEMIRKNMKWNQGKYQQKTFKELKEIFIMKSVLIISDLDKEIRVEANTSDFVMKEVL